MPSTWHGGRSGNRSSNTNRIMDADVFKPPISPQSANDPPASTSEQQDAITVLNAMHIEAHQIPRTDAKEHLQTTATRTTASEKIPTALAEFLARSSSHGFDCQASASGLGKHIEFSRAVKNNGMKDIATERKRLSPNPVDKAISEEPRSVSTKTLTTIHAPNKSEQRVDDDYQSKENESFTGHKDSHSVSQEAEVKKEMETPITFSSKPDAKTPHEQGTEPTTSCFYPIFPPYPYSPYGFHPIQPFMANHMTPQGGPTLYNSYGQTYYAPTPYSDMYTMYPVMQHYPTAPLETPTRLRVSPPIINNGQDEYQKELYDMSPKSKDKDEAH
jgi:hypothetical protein